MIFDIKSMLLFKASSFLCEHNIQESVLVLMSVISAPEKLREAVVLLNED